jgi:hypothetical protein
MRHALQLLITAIAATALTACHDLPEYSNDPQGNFEALWTAVDQHYCFFEEKGIDWDGIHSQFAPRVEQKMSSEKLFNLCAEMLDTLRDGHVNLSSAFNTSYYRKWWSDYPQNYDERLVQQFYFDFSYRSVGTIDYGFITTDSIGYMRYPSFSYSTGQGNLDAIFRYLAKAPGLIIDIRDNGGGYLTNVETLVSRFISGRTLAGYISHKTGPGHDEFSAPKAFYYDPAAGHLLWLKPVVVLTNRSTYSAANNFASIMKLLPDVWIVGATTGGGSGMPFSSELPNGWALRMSACPVLDANGDTTEQGVDPTEGCAVDLDPIQALNGHDTMLDFAATLLADIAKKSSSPAARAARR